MKTQNQITAFKNRTENVFNNLQDDVLDEYNIGNISKTEMINILKWCEKMKDRVIDDYEN